MLPTYYECSSCRERFDFKFREAYYHLGPTLMGNRVDDKDLLDVPVRPAWCKDCDSVSIVEDIAPLRTFEAAYGAVRSGRPAEYPFSSECWEPADATRVFGAYLRWRMERRHAARTLCCGGLNYQFMDVETPLIKHAECDFGFINGMCSISSYNGPGLGVRAPANIRVYTAEGELMGLLTWRHQDEGQWDLEKLSYQPPVDQ